MSEAAEGVPTAVPLMVRIAFAHASVQWLADFERIDVLHIKGAALHPSLVREGRSFTDVDVLVRPSQVQRLMAVLQQHGWQLQTSFLSGSAFGHSATLRHHYWGFADIHRAFPGLGPTPDAAFERLWQGRTQTQIAGSPCPVPAVPAQALILLLHAARAGGEDQRAASDIDHVWRRATESERNEIEKWVGLLQANLGFSVITGDLHKFRHRPDHDLWVVASQGGTRLEEWRARVKAERSLVLKLDLLRRATLVNVDHLSTVRGHRPSRRELRQEFVARFRRVIKEEWQRRMRSK